MATRQLVHSLKANTVETSTCAEHKSSLQIFKLVYTPNDTIGRKVIASLWNWVSESGTF